MPTFHNPAVSPMAVPQIAPTPPPPQLIGGAAPKRSSTQTLAELMARQKMLAEQANAAGQQPIVSPLQGWAMLANEAVTGLQERQAKNELGAGRDALAALQSKIGLNEPSADQIAEVGRYDPELAQHYYDTAMQMRALQAKQEKWSQIPTPQGESGQWFQNSVTGEQKKVGGSTEGGAPKLSDIASLRQDVIGDLSYKNLEQSVPIWQSMQDAASRDTPQADLNMIIGLAKLFDPTSVVRTQEGEAVKQTGDLPTEIYSQWAYLTSKPGARLSPQIRQGMLQEGWSRVKGYADAYEQTSKTYTDIAKRHNVDPADIVPSFGDLHPYEPAPPSPTDPKSPAGNYEVGKEYTFTDANGQPIKSTYLGGDPGDIKSWKPAGAR